MIPPFTECRRNILAYKVILVSLLMVSCGTASGPPEHVFDIIIENALVLTIDSEFQVFDPGFVAVSGSEIHSVGSMADRPVGSARRIIDGTRMVLMPGLVNGHQHAPMVLFRGIADDLNLMDWLTNYIFPVEARAVDEDLVYWGTLLASAEMIQSGTTTFADMYYFEDRIAEAASEIGIRAVLGQTIIGFPAPDHKTPEAALEYTEAFLRRWSDDDLVTPAVAPHSAYTCSTEILLASRDLAQKYNSPLLVHLAESPGEMQQVREATGTTTVKFLESIGFLGEPVLAAHSVWVDDEEIKTLRDRGVGVVHCPDSNMKLASGVAPVPRMLELGLSVGLGTDGAASNNNVDMFQAMDSMAKLHKITSMDPTLITAKQAVVAATLGSARAMDMADRIGSIEKGKKADLVLLNRNRAEASPLFDPYSFVVYAVRGGSVDTVVINGEIVFEKGALTRIDTARLFDEVDRLQAKISRILSSSSER